MTAPRFCIALGITAAIVIAGCGGDDRLTREEFVSEAEAICEEFDQRLEDVPDPESADDVERYVDEARPVIEDGLGELRALQPPEELEEQWDELMDRNDEALEVLDDLSEAAASADEARLQEISEEASRQDAETDRMARAIGLENCGSDETR
jgi:hypothetical protein